MREVFGEKPEPDKKSHMESVFYTVTPGDVGASSIRLAGGYGTIPVREVLGMAVQPGDVGCRFIRRPNEAGDRAFWQMEQPSQRDARQAREQGHREGTR